jgi:Sigma-70, region 4
MRERTPIAQALAELADPRAADDFDRAEILASLRGLPRRTQRIVVARWLDFTEEEIAERTGWSLRTIQREVAAARAAGVVLPPSPGLQTKRIPIGPRARGPVRVGLGSWEGSPEARLLKDVAGFSASRPTVFLRAEERLMMGEVEIDGVRITELPLPPEVAEARAEVAVRDRFGVEVVYVALEPLTVANPTGTRALSAGDVLSRSEVEHSGSALRRLELHNQIAPLPADRGLVGYFYAVSERLRRLETAFLLAGVDPPEVFERDARIGGAAA